MCAMGYCKIAAARACERSKRWFAKPEWFPLSRICRPVDRKACSFVMYYSPRMRALISAS